METVSSGAELVEQGTELLRGYLPQDWEVRVMGPDNVAGEDLLPARPAYLDSVIEVGDSGSFTRLMVEAKSNFGPRDVDTLLGGINRTLRKLAHAEVIVIASSLSARTRELLAESGINYLDLTGNVRVHLSHPGLFLERTSTAKAPRDQSMSGVAPGLRGPRAGRLVRTLVDAQGTWTVSELAKTAQLSPGYVSKLLESLEQEALVVRGHRGAVETVAWPALLRSWAQTYSVLRSNTTRGFIARRGPQALLQALANGPIGLPTWAVTGSYGAVTLAPVAGPAVLMLYTPAVSQLTGHLEQLLLPVDIDGADVLIIEPADDIMLKRVWTPLVAARQRNAETGVTLLLPIIGVPIAAPSQLVVDCLSGPGRMPAEGEALLKWMQQNESRWRAPSPADIDNARLTLASATVTW